MLDRQHPNLAQTITLNPSNPAAGADISFTVPTGVWYRFVMGTALLVTSATVATRGPSIRMDDASGNEYWATGQAGAGITAGSFGLYSFASGENAAQVANTSVAGSFDWPLPKIWLPPGWKFRTNTANLQAGDQYQSIFFVVAVIAGAQTGDTPLAEV